MGPLPGASRPGADLGAGLASIVACGGDGLDPAELTGDDGAVYCTPAHQYPLGGRMPVARRAQLLGWARETGGLIVEDDYDSEYRYDVSSLPPLRALRGARDHAAHIGTASKMLTPSLRLAWLVAPPALRDGLDTVLRATNSRAIYVLRVWLPQVSPRTADCRMRRGDSCAGTRSYRRRTQAPSPP